MNNNNWRAKRGLEESSTPISLYQPRRDHHQSFKSEENLSPLQRVPGDMLRQPLNDQKANQAIEEGRRIYIGNMPYEATVKDVEAFFNEISDGIEAINMSVDPMTGRNPSYCFMDLGTTALANYVMEKYNGQPFMRRPLRVRPGVKPKASNGGFNQLLRAGSTSNSLNRWNDLEGPESIITAAEEKRRLYFGGLPRFKSNEDCEAQLRALLNTASVTPDVVGKLVWRNEKMRWETGNHNSCFVDFRYQTDAERAIAKLNGMEKWGWKLVVQHAK